MSEFKKGDQIKVTVEGTVTYKSERGVEVLAATGQTVDLYTDGKVLSEDVAVEKIEPPVEVFGPGDLVRSKDSGAIFQLLGDKYDGTEGYIRLGQSLVGSYYVIPEGKHEGFTSERYEKIDLDEIAVVPF